MRSQIVDSQVNASAVLYVEVKKAPEARGFTLTAYWFEKVARARALADVQTEGEDPDIAIRSQDGEDARDRSARRNLLLARCQSSASAASQAARREDVALAAAHATIVDQFNRVAEPALLRRKVGRDVLGHLGMHRDLPSLDHAFYRRLLSASLRERFA